MKLKFVWLSISLLICSLTISAQLSVVNTVNGTVSGYKSGDIAIFKGIPFAAPPVGEFRWKAPQPVKNWTGVLKCEKFSASPIQNKPVPFMMWTKEFITPPGNLSEDCLYLNVWTPAQSDKEKLPVFVWIYGGGFSSGSAACDVYDGEEMAKKGIIFISFNYRVGVLGFLAHPELSAESENKVSGNYGLLDQVAALTWINENIKSFGGDPEKVTIGGQSAGSMSVVCPGGISVGKRSFPRCNSRKRRNIEQPYRQSERCRKIRTGFYGKNEGNKYCRTQENFNSEDLISCRTEFRAGC